MANFKDKKEYDAWVEAGKPKPEEDWIAEYRGEGKVITVEDKSETQEEVTAAVQNAVENKDPEPPVSTDNQEEIDKVMAMTEKDDVRKYAADNNMKITFGNTGIAKMQEKVVAKLKGE